MKYYILFLTTSILMFSCGHSDKKVSKCNNKTHSDSLIYSISANILGDKYRADFRSNMILYVLNSKNDTLIARKESGISSVPLVFEDYNNDGNLDIRYGYNSNYFSEMILLFDSKTKGFRKIDGIDDPGYAYSKNIKGTDFYYSYSPDGCGKNNWISRLFIIKDFKIIALGLIRYKQCADDDKGIYIYALKGDKADLSKKFALIESDKHKEAFYEYYWINNYKTFKR